MKLLVTLATLAILLSGCGGSAVPNNPPAASTPVKIAVNPIPDDIGLIMRCDKCVFRQEHEQRYFAGQISNDAKQAISGYVLSVDLQDAQGNSVKKIDGLMLMDAMVLQPGETKDFKDRVLSAEANVTQATVYFKKAGREIKLSEPLTLKLNGPPATSPAAKPVGTVVPKQ
jgi:hypothetical protein